MLSLDITSTGSLIRLDLYYRSSRIPDYMSCRGKAKRQNDSAEHAGARNGMQPIRMRKEMIVMKKRKQKCRKPK